MRVAKRIPPYSKPCKRLPAKIPNPLPKTTSDPIPTEGNCVFHDLRAKSSPKPKTGSQLPPILPNPVGRIVGEDELEKMQQLRAENPKRWTITALSGEFNVHRSFIIKNVLTANEKKQADEELIERIDSLSFTEKRGWLMRYKIREHRRDLWILDELRRQSGFKPDDYGPYRKFCGRQIRRINCLTGGTENSNASTKKKHPEAKGRQLSAKESMIMLLLKAERAGTSAMILRTEGMKEPRKVVHARKRWKKAESYAQSLIELIPKLNSNRLEELEIQEYLRFTRANKHFEYGRWKEAYEEFSSSHQAYSLLSSPSHHLSKIPIIAERVEITLSMMRYCHHMMKQANMEDNFTVTTSIPDVEMEKISEDTSNNQLKCYGFIIQDLSQSELDQAVNESTHGRWIRQESIRTLEKSAPKLLAFLVFKKRCSRWMHNYQKLEGCESLLHYPLRRGTGKIGLISDLGVKAKSLCHKLDRFLKINQDREFVDECSCLRRSLIYLSTFFGTTAKILRNKIDILPELPPANDFHGTIIDEIDLEDVAKWERKWKDDLEKIIRAAPVLDGFELTPYGLQSIKRPATFLETFDEFRIFPNPRKAIFDPNRVMEMIPTKPIFYDLAYDLLEPPKLIL